jgi:2-methylisocitrate lyase-like PEP mutase family enzyme
MSKLTKPARRLRELLASSELVVAPGAFNPIVARQIEEAGFPAVYLTGAGVAAAIYGLPDTGQITMTELVAAAANVVATISIPVICDADCGFGNPLNVRRTVQQLEAAGVAAMHIEDQAFPKKCGFFEGHVLISIEEMVHRLEAAREARRDPDFMIIARIESMGTSGIEETIERARAYVDAGADMTFVNGVTSEADAARIGEEVSGLKLYNVSTSGKTPHLHEDRIRELGYSLAIYPAHTLFLALHGIREMLGDLKEKRSIEPWLDRMIDFNEWKRVTGVPEVEALERRYGSKDE